MNSYYIYILANEHGTLYIGMTDDLRRRVWEHQNDVAPGFTEKYQIHKLIYYEETNDVHVALEREKQLKRWRRDKKLDLIHAMNPGWNDLSEEIFL